MRELVIRQTILEMIPCTSQKEIKNERSLYLTKKIEIKKSNFLK